MLSNSILHSFLSINFNTSMFSFCFEWKIHKKNFIHALNASMFRWMALGIGSPSVTDITLKICLDQNSKPPKPTIHVSHLYMDVIFSPLLAYTLFRKCQTEGWAITLQRPRWAPVYEKLCILVSHRSRQSCADQSLLGRIRCAPDFRNRTRNMFNHAKERGVSEEAWPGGYSVPFYITARMGVRDSLASPKRSRGFGGGNVARGQSHSPLFIVTQGLQEHFACKSLLLLYTFLLI